MDREHHYRLLTRPVDDDALLWAAGLCRRGGKPELPGRVCSVLHEQHQRHGGAGDHVDINGGGGSCRGMVVCTSVDFRQPYDGAARGGPKDAAGKRIYTCNITLKHASEPGYLQ